jgi:hypothetical protein
MTYKILKVRANYVTTPEPSTMAAAFIFLYKMLKFMQSTMGELQNLRVSIGINKEKFLIIGIYVGTHICLTMKVAEIRFCKDTRQCLQDRKCPPTYCS